MTNRAVLACLMVCGLVAAARAQDATASSLPSLALYPPAVPRLAGRAAPNWSQYYDGAEGGLGDLLDPFARGRLYSLSDAKVALKHSSGLQRLKPYRAGSGRGRPAASVEAFPSANLKRAGIGPVPNITITPGLMVTIDNGAGRSPILYGR